MELEIAGKTALITGGARGIGFACAGALAAEGCAVHLAGRSREALTEARARLHSRFGVTVCIHIIDLASPQAPQQLAAEAGDMDILVNNAGSIPPGSLLAIGDAELRAAFDLKLFGYIGLAREYFARMSGRSGVIVNIIGTAGERGNSDYFAGATANAALMSFTRAVGGTSLDRGVRIVGVNPGPIATDRIVRLMRDSAAKSLGDPDRWQELVDKLPGGRLGKPEQVADLVAFLASPRAGHINATVVTIDGGLTSRA